MATIEAGGRVFITSDARAHFHHQELAGIGNAFAVGDLRALVIVQWWVDGECANAWHVETEQQRRDIIAKLKEMVAELERSPDRG